MINDAANARACALKSTLCEKSFTVEVSGDFTLPDYQNEIRRILHVFPTVLPPSKYVGGDSAEFGGTVDYQVLYIGGDGGVYSAALSSEYTFSVPFEGEGNTYCLCHVSAENVTTRVSAPRRLSIKTRLRPNVRLYGDVDCSLDVGESVSVASVYTKKQGCISTAVYSATSDIISISHISPLPSEDTRVVWAEAVPLVGQTKISDGGVSCSGEVGIKLLCVKDESGEYSTVTGSVPFEGEIDLDGCTENARVRVRGCTAELSVEVTDAGIECSAGIMLEASCLLPAVTEYTDDVYSTERACECSMRTVSTRDVLYCDNASFTLSERIPMSSANIPEGCELLSCTGTCTMDKCVQNGTRLNFSGSASFTVLYMKDGEPTCSDVSVPVKYECANEGGREPVCFDACVQLTDIKARLSDSNLCIDAELMLSADALCAENVTFAEGAVFGEQSIASCDELVVCYPSENDTAWSIAKRYSVAPNCVIGNPATDKYVIIE